jgi:hypothetical protein
VCVTSEYDIPIKTLVKMFEKIGEKVTPDMIGGEFLIEEKVMLIDNAIIQNKWIIGKAYMKQNKSDEVLKSRKRVGYSNI